MSPSKKLHSPKGVDWSVAKVDFLTQNLRREAGGKPYTLRDVAEKWGVSYGQVRNVAARDKWNQELAQQKEARAKAAVQSVQTYEQYNEAEIRSRQARYARLAMGKAMQKLNSVDPAKLTVKEAIELLRLGLVEERKALGMPEAFTFTPAQQGEDGEYKSVIDHINRQKELSSLSQKLLDFVDSKAEATPRKTAH